MTEDSRQPPHLASAEDIQRWAEDTVSARTEFPRLIRRLIQQTNDQVTSLQMRAGVGAGEPGYDGIVEANRGTPFVPIGRSVWELGTGGDPARKANEDYNERTSRPLGEDQTSTTFVFVTSRRWGGGQAWARTRRESGPWRDVKVFDADDIETALESAPAAHYWISELLGKPVSGIQTIEDWWSRFSVFTAPALSPELVLAGRLDQASQLLRIMEQDCQITTVASASTDDVLAFVAAVLLSSPEEERDGLIARTLIVQDALSFRRLETSSGLLVLLPFEDKLRRAAQLVRTHHVVFLAHGDGHADIQLPPVDFDVFKAELEKVGVESDRVHALAVAARQSLVTFQRTAGGALPLSLWQTQLEDRAVRRAWLAGSWSERRTGDQDVLSSFLALPFEEALDGIRAAADGADPLFTVVGDTWKVSSIEDSWPYARRRLATSDLATLESAVQTVLGAIDPALDLPIEERWTAAIHGKARVHSGELRRGLAQTLAFLSAHGGEAPLTGGVTAKSWADAAAARLLQRTREDPTGQLWSSIADVLPLLAEAAPDPFLRAVEGGTREPDPLLSKMFIDEGAALSVNSPHTGLLWALEVVAWSTEHAGFVVRLLGRLSEVDPGGRLSNRPFSSLVNILKPGLPQTSLPANRRLAVIDDLIARHNAVGFRLLVALLPDTFALGQPSQSPRFRWWKPAEVARPTPAEYWSFTDSVVDRIMEEAGTNGERWAQVIGKLSDLSPEQRGKVRTKLAELAGAQPAPMSDGSRRRVWGAMDDLIRRHQTYSDAGWVLAADELDLLTEVADALKPADPVDRHRWLFDDHMPDLGEGGRADAQDYEEQLRRARTTAMVEIAEAGGLAEVMRLAGDCEVPWAVGWSLADGQATLDDDEVTGYLDDPAPKLVDFARGFVTRKLSLEAERGDSE